MPHRIGALGAAAAATALLVVPACSRPAPRPLAGDSSSPSPATPGPVTTSPATPSAVGTTAGASEGSRCEQVLLARLTLPQRVGQLLMVGVPASDPAAGVRVVRAYGLGGVFLAGRSSAGVAATRTAVDRLRRESATAPRVPLTVAADQEGGYVQTLTGPGFDAIPTALRQGAQPAGQLGSMMRSEAGQLRAAGVTLDLAPVTDTVAPGAVNPPIGAFDREYARTPDAVATKIRVVVAGMRAGGVGATVKHFPGLGRVRANTDTSTGAVDPVTSPTDPDLRPFRAGIAAGAAAVMVSSARYPRLDRRNVAAFSSAIITGLLRRSWGYRRLVVSDDLGAAVAVRDVPLGQRAVRFVAAGGDVVLDVRTVDAPVLAAALLSRARTDADFRRQVDAAALRVLASKVGSRTAPCG